MSNVEFYDNLIHFEDAMALKIPENELNKVLEK